MSRDEATLIGEEKKPVTIAIIELCLSEGISKSASHLASQETFKIVGRVYGRHDSHAVLLNTSKQGKLLDLNLRFLFCLFD